MTKTATPKAATLPGKYIATNPPKIAPMAVPMKRCAEIGRASPRVDCITITAEIAAQYVSGSGNKRATSSETTTATAVRAAFVSVGGFSLAMISCRNRSNVILWAILFRGASDGVRDLVLGLNVIQLRFQQRCPGIQFLSCGRIGL